MSAAWFIGGAIVGGVAVMWLMPPATETSCCARVAAAARDEIAAQTGVPGAVLDFLGITGHLPGLLDRAGL